MNLKTASMQPLSMSSRHLQGVGTVVAPIASGQRGRVRYRASDWPALCPAGFSLAAGDRVEVIGNRSIVLLVMPLATEADVAPTELEPTQLTPTELTPTQLAPQTV